MLMSSDYGRIKVVDLPIELSVLVFLALESFEYAIPHPTLLPAVEAAGNRSPRTILLGEVTPG